MPVGVPQHLLDDGFLVLDHAHHADGVGPVNRAHQQGLGIGVADAADAALAHHLPHRLVKLGAEGGVLDVVDLPLEAQLRVPGGHAAPAGAQVGVIVCAEINV